MLTLFSLLFFLIVGGAEESPEVKQSPSALSGASGGKHSSATGSYYSECQLNDIGCSSPFQNAVEEALSAETAEEALEMDRNLAEMRDEIDAIRGKLAAIGQVETARIRFQLPVRQIRNQLKMANRFGKRDKLRMSNRFG